MAPNRMEIASAGQPRWRAEWLGHPIGLPVLFSVEMWERFSYYGMRAILVLYIIAVAKDGPHGGLGWSQEEALGLYGWYTMAVYVASIPGGLIADKLWGQKRTVMVGGLTLCAGHLVLALPGQNAGFLRISLSGDRKHCGRVGVSEDCVNSRIRTSCMDVGS